MLPIIRTFISLPAGVARMPFWRFTLLTLAGCVPWVLLLGFIGEQVGDNWEEWRDYLHYGDYVVLAAIVGLIIYWLIRRRRNGTQPAEAAPDSMTAGAPGLSARRAAILGAVQGPAELLPVSSSAHLSLIPWFRGWRWDELDPEARKSFEVALHAGTAAALLIGQRRVIAAELAAFDTRRAAVVALSFVPPASPATPSSARSRAGLAGRGASPRA